MMMMAVITGAPSAAAAADKPAVAAQQLAQPWRLRVEFLDAPLAVDRLRPLVSSLPLLLTQLADTTLCFRPSPIQLIRRC
jgi:hypothetical protein